MSSHRAAVAARWTALHQALLTRPRLALQPCAAAAASSASAACRHRGFASGANFGGNFHFGGFPGQGGPPRGDNQKFYSLLGVDQNASEAEIKAAYKKQAMKHHPDRGGDEATFKEISRAYEVLSDPEKRQVYDSYGEDGLEGGAGGGAQHVDPFDLFGQIFGFNVGGGRKPRGRPVTADSTYQCNLTLEELYSGASRSINFNRSVLCGACKGMGGQETRKCKDCKGEGRQVRMQSMGMFVQHIEQVCSPCGGRGYIIPPKSICSCCKGKGTTQDKQTFNINVDPGTEDGKEFRFRGQADEAPGHDTGDVVVVIREQPHRTFQRARDLLLMTKKIKLAEALCGFEFSVPFLDGTDLVVRSKPGQVVKPGDVMVIPGKGMPNPRTKQFGDLFLTLEVEFPASVSTENAAKLAEVLGGKPLPEEPPLGAAFAEKLSQRKAEELRRRILEARERGQSSSQGVNCQQS